MTISDVEFEKRATRREKALGVFHQWSHYTSLGDYGMGLPAFERLVEANRAVRGWRQASNTRGGDYEEEKLAVRVVADSLANQIAAAAPDQDDTTLLWVLAGLRCPSRPFCSGCPSCQSVTSPLRPMVALRSSWR